MALTGMIGEARADCADTDPVDPAVDDSIYTTKINKYYLLTHARDEKRVAEMTATASGYTFAISEKVKTGTPLNWFEVVQAFRVAAAGNVYGAPLSIRPVHEVLRLQSSSATPGTPTIVGFTRHATSVAASIGKWDAYLHPIPDATCYVGLLVRAWPVLLSGSGDTPDLTELEAYTVAKLAAAEVAYILGEPERAEWILRSVPDETLAHYGVARAGYKPPRDLAEVAA